MSARQTHRFVMKLPCWPHASLRLMERCFPEHHHDPANPMRLLSAIDIPDAFCRGFLPPDAAPLPPPHQVDIPLGNGVLHAQLYKPDGDGPFPIVIALHGCGGLGRPFRAGPAALSRLGRAIAEGGRRGVAAGQLRFARTRSAMPRQGAPGARPPRAGRGHHGIAAMAGAAALGRARSHQPVGMGERRQRAVVGGASATVVAQRRAGFPLGDRVLSGLPHLVGPWLERAGSDAAADRRQGRRQFAARLPPDDRRRARPQRAGADRGLSRRLSRFRPRRICRCTRSPATSDAAVPEHGHLGTDTEARANSQKRVAEWLAR